MPGVQPVVMPLRLGMATAAVPATVRPGSTGAAGGGRSVGGGVAVRGKAEAGGHARRFGGPAASVVNCCVWADE